MVKHEAIQQWLLHGTGIQLQQSTTIWHNTLISSIKLIPICKTTNITSVLHLEASLDSLKFAIEPLLDAKHRIIYGLRTSTAF